MVTGPEFSVNAPTTTTIDTNLLYAYLAAAMVIVLFYIAVNWRLFSKAGRPGWISLIPIYNTYVALKIAGKSGWWLLLFCIPIINIVFVVLYSLAVARSFGKGPLFGIFGLLIFSAIGYPILAFGGARYVGPGGQSSGETQTPSGNEPPQMPTTNQPHAPIPPTPPAQPAMPQPQAPVTPPPVMPTPPPVQPPQPEPQPQVQPQPRPTPPPVDAMTPPPPRPGSVVYPPGQEPPTPPAV